MLTGNRSKQPLHRYLTKSLLDEGTYVPQSRRSSLRDQYTGRSKYEEASVNKTHSSMNEENFNDFIKIIELDEVQKLKKMFLLYSANEKVLYSKKYNNLLSDAQILDKNFDSNYADIIFFAACKTKSNINFNEFCNIIVKISEIKFPEEYMKNQSKALDKLLQKFLFPLLNNIININKSTCETTLFSWEIYLGKLSKGKNPFFIIKHFYCLAKIYKKYFSWENLNITDYEKSNLSEKAFIKFCREFEICPTIVSLIKLSEIFQNIMMNTKLILNSLELIHFNEQESVDKANVDLLNQGTYFTLYHFIASLYLIGVQNLINLKNEFVTDQLNNDEDSSTILYNFYLEYFHELVDNFYKSEAIKDIFPKENLNSEFNNLMTSKKLEKQKTSRKFILETEISSNRNKENKMNNNVISDKNLNKNVTSTTNTNAHSIQLEESFFNKYKDILVSIYKFYSNLFSEVNFSIFLTFNGFVKFMKDLGLVYIPPDKNYLYLKSFSKGMKTIPSKVFKEKLNQNLFSYNFLNLLFAKYSSETFKPFIKQNTKDLQKDHQLIKESNKKMNFYSFIKIICCVSNKIFNSKFKGLSFESNKNINIEMFLDFETDVLQKYLEMFIGNYLLPCYNDIKSFIEKETHDLLLLDQVYSDENVEDFITKIKPVLFKIFLIYNDGKTFFNLDQFMKFCIDFDIFPDLATKSKIIHLFMNFISDFDQKNVIGGDPYFYIQFDHFIGIIIFIALGSKLGVSHSDEFILIKTILYFFQRMIQSNGLKKTSLYTGNCKICTDFTLIFNKFKNFIEEQPILKKNFKQLIATKR